MIKFKPEKGSAFFYILMITIIFDILIFIVLYLINSYVLATVLKGLAITFNVYQLYYIIMGNTVQYVINEDNIEIMGIFGLKKYYIPISSIIAYNTSKGKIKGVKLTGYGNDNFALGKSIVDKIGIANMFVTSNKSILYLKTEDMCFGVSPSEFEKFEGIIKSSGITKAYWETKRNRDFNLFKDKNFLVALILTTVTIALIIIIPFVLYLKKMYPANMPLAFDTTFTPMKIGTGKQFAFKQMSYGVLNAAVLFFLYYASYFYAKYDKKSAYKFIYIALLTSVIFLIMLLKTLNVYLK